jgi:hypothetical protein
VAPTVSNPVLKASIAPFIVIDPEEVVLGPDDAHLDGAITVSAQSEIPSGIHQLFDSIANFAIRCLDQRYDK